MEKASKILPPVAFTHPKPPSDNSKFTTSTPLATLQGADAARSADTTRRASGLPARPGNLAGQRRTALQAAKREHALVVGQSALRDLSIEQREIVGKLMGLGLARDLAMLIAQDPDNAQLHAVFCCESPLIDTTAGKLNLDGLNAEECQQVLHCVNWLLPHVTHERSKGLLQNAAELLEDGAQRLDPVASPAKRVASQPTGIDRPRGHGMPQAVLADRKRELESALEEKLGLVLTDNVKDLVKNAKPVEVEALRELVCGAEALIDQQSIVARGPAHLKALIDAVDILDQLAKEASFRNTTVRIEVQGKKASGTIAGEHPTEAREVVGTSTGSRAFLLSNLGRVRRALEFQRDSLPTRATRLEALGLKDAGNLLVSHQELLEKVFFGNSPLIHVHTGGRNLVVKLPRDADLVPFLKDLYPKLGAKGAGVLELIGEFAKVDKLEALGIGNARSLRAEPKDAKILDELFFAPSPLIDPDTGARTAAKLPKDGKKLDEIWDMVTTGPAAKHIPGFMALRNEIEAMRRPKDAGPLLTMLRLPTDSAQMILLDPTLTTCLEELFADPPLIDLTAARLDTGTVEEIGDDSVQVVYDLSKFIAQRCDSRYVGAFVALADAMLARGAEASAEEPEPAETVDALRRPAGQLGSNKPEAAQRKAGLLTIEEEVEDQPPQTSGRALDILLMFGLGRVDARALLRDPIKASYIDALFVDRPPVVDLTTGRIDMDQLKKMTDREGLLPIVQRLSNATTDEGLVSVLLDLELALFG